MGTHIWARNDSDLASNIGSLPGGGPRSDFIPHHIVVVSIVAKDDGKANPRQQDVRDAIKDGYDHINRTFDINKGRNGVWLPKFPKEAEDLNLPLHGISGDGTGLHTPYTNTIQKLFDQLAKEYTTGLKSQLTRINNSGAKNKGTRKEKEQENFGEAIYQFIELKAMPNIRKLLEDDKVFLNYNDPDFRASYMLANPDVTDEQYDGARYPQLRLLLENNMLSDERIRYGRCIHPTHYHRTTQNRTLETCQSPC